MDSLRPGLYDLRAEAGSAWSEWQHNVLIRAGSEVNVTLRLVRESPPVVVKVALKGVIREWAVPMVEDPGPHDPAVDPHGIIWMTLQNADQLARLDPQTGEWKFFSVPTQDAKPLGLASDAEGNIWFAENGAGKIGRLDARSSAVTEFAVPGRQAIPTALLSVPTALCISLRQTPTSSSVWIPGPARQDHSHCRPPWLFPNAIVSGPDGALWFCEFGVNQLGRLDPVTGSITEFCHPRRQGTPAAYRGLRPGDLLHRFWRTPRPL